jgi:hypothetical protein
LAQAGIEPAPLRRQQYSWATFSKAHLNVLAAADFFIVEVLSLLGRSGAGGHCRLRGE